MNGELGRRSFLKLVGSAGASAALSPLSAVAIDRDLYVNSTLGISLRKPQGWHFLGVRDFRRMMDTQEARPAYPELLKEIRDLAGEPFLAISKFRAEHDRFSPAAQFWVDPIDEADESVPVEWLCHREAQHLKRYYEGYRIVEPVQMRKLNGFNAGAFTFECVFDDGETRHPARVESWVLRTARGEFTFAYSGLQSGPSRAAFEFERMHASLELW